VSPRSLLLLSFASSSLLFSFLFALFALRHGRPTYLPFASAPIGVNASAVAIAGAPALGGSVGGAEAAEVDEAVRGRRSRDWVAEGARRAVAGDLSPAPAEGSAIVVKGAVTGGGNGGYHPRMVRFWRGKRLGAIRLEPWIWPWRLKKLFMSTDMARSWRKI